MTTRAHPALVLLVCLAAGALDGGQAPAAPLLLLGRDFDGDERAYYPPKGIPMKGVQWQIGGGIKADKGIPVFDANGKLTKEGYYFCKLATDPAWWRKHWEYALTDGWKREDTPVFSGTVTNNFSIGHRMLGVLNSFAGTVRNHRNVDPVLRARIQSPVWRDGCEEVLRSLLGARGLLSFSGNEYPMAQSFHLLRSGFQDGRSRGTGLREEAVYTLEHAQRLVRALLTDPDLCSWEDRWLKGSPEYLARIKRKSSVADDGTGSGGDRGDDAGGPAGTANTPVTGGFDNSIQVKGDTVLYTGGLFIGWGSSHPSLHASWDGLAIMNILYSHYPEPDPSKESSLFHLWWQQSPELKERGTKLITLCARRLWHDYQEHHKPVWTRIVGGQPSADALAPADLPQVPDHDGYTDKDMTHWAMLCWREVFDSGTTQGKNYGVQCFLAIANGKPFAIPADIALLEERGRQQNAVRAVNAIPVEPAGTRPGTAVFAGAATVMTMTNVSTLDVPGAGKVVVLDRANGTLSTRVKLEPGRYEVVTWLQAKDQASDAAELLFGAATTRLITEAWRTSPGTFVPEARDFDVVTPDTFEVGVRCQEKGLLIQKFIMRRLDVPAQPAKPVKK